MECAGKMVYSCLSSMGAFGESGDALPNMVSDVSLYSIALEHSLILMSSLHMCDCGCRSWDS